MIERPAPPEITWVTDIQLPDHRSIVIEFQGARRLPEAEAEEYAVEIRS